VRLPTIDFAQQDIFSGVGVPLFSVGAERSKDSA
jgi:hypothetical protein